MDNTCNIQNGYSIDYNTNSGYAGVAIVNADTPNKAVSILQTQGSFSTVGYKVKSIIPLYHQTHIQPEAYNKVVSEVLASKGGRGPRGPKGEINQKQLDEIVERATTVTDIKVNNQSVLTNKVANIDLSTYVPISAIEDTISGDANKIPSSGAIYNYLFTSYQPKLIYYKENPNTHTSTISVIDDDNASMLMVAPKNITFSNFTTYSGELQGTSFQVDSTGAFINGVSVMTSSDLSTRLATNLNNLDAEGKSEIEKIAGKIYSYKQEDDRIVTSTIFNDPTNVAIGPGSHAEGFKTIAGTTNTNAAHSEGQFTKALGPSSHAEGYGCIVTTDGQGSHAEGYCAVATGYAAHAEGIGWNDSLPASYIDYDYVGAQGRASHVEGGAIIDGKIQHNNAEGEGSHAEGIGTYAFGEGAHVEGKFNYGRTTQIHAVGIGSSNADRKNAHEILITGEHYIYGIGGYDGTNPYAGTTKSLQDIINSNTIGVINKSIEFDDGTTDTLSSFVRANDDEVALTYNYIPGNDADSVSNNIKLDYNNFTLVHNSGTDASNRALIQLSDKTITLEADKIILNDELRYKINRARLDAEFAEILAASHDIAVRELTSSSEAKTIELGDTFESISSPSWQDGDTVKLISSGRLKEYARITSGSGTSKTIGALDRLFSSSVGLFKSSYTEFANRLTEINYLDCQFATSLCSTFEGSGIYRINYILPSINCQGATGLLYGEASTSSKNRNLEYFAGMDCSSLVERYNKRPGWQGNWHPLVAFFGSNYNSESNYRSQIRNLPIFRNLECSLDYMRESNQRSLFAELPHIFRLHNSSAYQPDEEIDRQIIDFMDSLGEGKYWMCNPGDGKGGTIGQRAFVAFNQDVYNKILERMNANPEVRSAIRYAMNNKNWVFTKHSGAPSWNDYLHP